MFLPYGLKSEEKEFILLHEQIHIKRKDHIIKPFAFLILTIHWFNQAFKRNVNETLSFKGKNQTLNIVE
ncbi:MAG: hypothetical protein GX995_10285 [Clostridiales bacterium]|nr:hypothetical protein [Clostridiales bacterium]